MNDSSLLIGLTVNKARKTNKMSIEDLVKFKSENFDSSELNTTVNMAKHRGTVGLPLAKFVDSQIRHDQ